MQCIIIVGEELLASIAMEQIERDSSSTSALPLAICMIMSMANIFIETIGDITLNILNLGFSFGYTVIPEFSSCSPRTLNSWLAAFVLVYTLRSAFEFVRHLRSRARHPESGVSASQAVRKMFGCGVGEPTSHSDAGSVMGVLSCLVWEGG